MTEAVTPNPYSPWADAMPSQRHIFAVPHLFQRAGASPVPGTLASTSCGRLAVVPEDVIEIGPSREQPVNACPTCFDAMREGAPRELACEPMPCTDCGTSTRHTGLCALCRQERHDAWSIDQANAEAAKESSS